MYDAKDFYDTPYENVTNVWVCIRYPECDAYVIAHRDRDMAPLGPLANGALRMKRNQAHQAFDRLWRKKIFSSRKEAYAWLGDLMGVGAGKKQWHIGEMGETMCDIVIRESKRVYNNYLKNRKE